MAKVTIQTFPVKPPLKVTLELNLDEAVVIAKICGRVSGDGQTGRITARIYEALIENKRIYELAAKMEMEMVNQYVHPKVIPIGHCVVPTEE